MALEKLDAMLRAIEAVSDHRKRSSTQSLIDAAGSLLAAKAKCGCAADDLVIQMIAQNFKPAANIHQGENDHCPD